MVQANVTREKKHDKDLQILATKAKLEKLTINKPFYDGMKAESESETETKDGSSKSDTDIEITQMFTSVNISEQVNGMNKFEQIVDYFEQMDILLDDATNKLDGKFLA